jgi:hypothetical protein
MLRVLCLLLAVTVLAPAGEIYQYTKTTGLSATAESVTLHLPSSASGVQAVIKSASVYCSVACTITIERDGSAPTTTAATAVRLNRYSQPAAVTPYYSSDVGAGTGLSSFRLAAGALLPLDFGGKVLQPGDNLTLTTDAITGTVVFNFQWEER